MSRTYAVSHETPTPLRVAQAPGKPQILFDGDCRFCRFWIDRWRPLAEGRVEFAPSQEAASKYPEIPAQAYNESVQWVGADGEVAGGAEAVVRLLEQLRGRGWLAGLARKTPGAMPLLATGYRMVARHRAIFSWLTRLLYGTHPQASTYAVSRRIFAHGLGLVFFFAFASLTTQIRPLLGEHGLAPAGEFLRIVREQLGGGAYWQLPTLFWLHCSDLLLQLVCWLGVAVSLVMACGLMPGACSLLLWALYLSICSIGGPFLNFQWDALLLETALPAAILLPWSLRPDWSQTNRLASLGRWLLWWLIFRLMFESGVVKLSSGDPTWRSLTAMTYHYETQPLPLWTAWYAHHAPLWVHKLEVLITFAIEFLAPLAILTPRRLRHLGAGVIVALQVGIASTGNYTFFNLLTALLCVPLLDDHCWPAQWRERPLGARAPAHRMGASVASWMLEPLAVLSVMVTGASFCGTFRENIRWPRPIAWLETAVQPMRSFNSYGLFRVMTTQRREIEVQGSNDGQEWLAYEFPYKPGDVRQRPRLVAPFQPRLDWQMWFAALGTYRENPWLISLLSRLLEGRPEILALLEENPFPRQPPKYVRAVVYQYHYTDDLHAVAWWRREELGLYSPPLSLRTAETPPTPENTLR